MNRHVKLVDWPLPTLRLHCGGCDETAEIEKDVLLALYDGDQTVLSLRDDLVSSFCEGSPAALGCEAFIEIPLETDD